MDINSGIIKLFSKKGSEYLFKKSKERILISSHKNSGDKAFTLAEVLIVLGIIGIIAALTIPTIVNNYQKQTYITGLKKFYTTTNQVLLEMANDNGTPGSLAGTGLFAAGTTSTSFGDEFVKYFKVAKNCQTDTGCWPDKTFRNYDAAMTSNTIDQWDQNTLFYKFITTDGMSIMLRTLTDSSGTQDCNSNKALSFAKDLKASKVCGFIYVDVNGLNGPNIMGRDTFELYITDGKGPALDAYGAKDTYIWWGSNGFCSTRTIGYSCAARVIEDGWQMTY